MRYDAAIVGDITPDEGISKERKYKLENEAMQQIKRILGDTSPAGEPFCGKRP
jgi:hypothetical protein